MRKIAGKRVLITGAGHGLGRAIAEAFASAGAQVVVTDLHPDWVAETVRSLTQAGKQACGYAMDISQIEQVREVRQKVMSDEGPIDVLINNAGIVHGGPFLDVPLEGHLATYRVNAGGTVIVTHTFLPDLLARPEAHLVNISSGSGLIALPFASTYASTKWAILGFTDSLREELRLLGHRHVGVTTCCPSYISTGQSDGARPPLLTRMLRPEEVARLVLKGVQKNQEMVLTPWLVRATPLTKGILPRSWFRFLNDMMGVTSSLSEWRQKKP
jgi:all-trans-retinol dehydrogenase (NAD+)